MTSSLDAVLHGLHMVGPFRPLTKVRSRCGAARQIGHSPQLQNLGSSELTLCGILLTFA